MEEHHCTSADHPVATPRSPSTAASTNTTKQSSCLFVSNSTPVLPIINTETDSVITSTPPSSNPASTTSATCTPSTPKTPVVASLPSLPISDSSPSVSLRFPIPQGNERLARWLAHSDDRIMAPTQDISTPPVVISSFPVEEETDLLAESTYELVSNEDSESQNGLTPQLSLGTASQGADDDVHSLADSESDAASEADHYEHQTVPSQLEIDQATNIHRRRIAGRSTTDLMDEDEVFDTTPQPSQTVIDYMTVASDATAAAAAATAAATAFTTTCCSPIHDAASVITESDVSDDDMHEPTSIAADYERTPRGSQHNIVVIGQNTPYHTFEIPRPDPNAEPMSRSSSIDYMEDSLGKPSTPEMSQILECPAQKEPNKKKKQKKKQQQQQQQQMKMKNSLLLSIYESCRARCETLGPAPPFWLLFAFLPTYIFAFVYYCKFHSGLLFPIRQTTPQVPQFFATIGTTMTPVITTHTSTHTSTHYVYITTTATTATTTTVIATAPPTDTPFAPKVWIADAVEHLYQYLPTEIKDLVQKKSHKMPKTAQSFQSFKSNAQDRIQAMTGRLNNLFKEQGVPPVVEHLNKATSYWVKFASQAYWSKVERLSHDGPCAARTAIAKAELGLLSSQLKAKAWWFKVQGKVSQAQRYEAAGNKFLHDMRASLSSWVKEDKKTTKKSARTKA